MMRRWSMTAERYPGVVIGAVSPFPQIAHAANTSGCAWSERHARMPNVTLADRLAQSRRNRDLLLDAAMTDLRFIDLRRTSLSKKIATLRAYIAESAREGHETNRHGDFWWRCRQIDCVAAQDILRDTR
jgi:hypothetical protein